MEGLSTVSQKHRIAELRRDLWGLSAPEHTTTETPATAKSPGKHPGKLGLKISKDENSTVQSPDWKKMFCFFFYLIFKLLLVFPFTTIIICPVTGHHLVNLLYSVCFIHLEKIPHKDESNQISPNSLSLSSLRDTPILIHL